MTDDALFGGMDALAKAAEELHVHDPLRFEQEHLPCGDAAIIAPRKWKRHLSGRWYADAVLAANQLSCPGRINLPWVICLVACLKKELVRLGYGKRKIPNEPTLVFPRQ